MRPKNYHPYIVNSPSRRRGQALLLAVLVMVFVVLLGTTFLAIVTSNMSQTARTSSKDQARQAAQAGIDFADEELTGSDDGLNWRPAASIPANLYNFYWTSFDRAQGWDQQLYTSQTNSATQASFVKYPDPLAFTPSGNGSNFMIRVSQVQASDPDNSTGDKTNDIRIESIGIANDDPAAFYKTVAYKQGPASNPLTAAMRSVTNWDFGSKAVPQGYLNVTGGPGSINEGSTLTLSNVKGYFDASECPFYVTITSLPNMDDSSPPQVFGAEVTGVNYMNGEPQLMVNGTLVVNTSQPTAQLLIQKAAALGAPLTVNYDNANPTPVDYRISGANNFAGAPVNTPGSVWVNGGLVWYGNNPTNSGISGFDGIKATNLIAPSAATAASPASIIKISGLFTSTTTAPATTPATVQVSGTTSSGTVAGTLPQDSIATTNTNSLITGGLVDDGLNRLQGSQDPTRQVQDFTPPDITSGGDGFGRYRQLTRYSAPDITDFPSATNISSAYGYGQGIYINNPQDVEKTGISVMTQADLQKLWYTAGTVASAGYERSQQPQSSTVNNYSLEDQHIRGWISPDQFLPRGAQVVLNANNTITVTLDSTADNDPSIAACGTDPTLSATIPFCNSLGAVADKGWRDVSGNLLGDATNGGVYTQTFNWPADGTLFAEGNIRISGSAPNAPSSLTVVSMNNIYIEGSLSTGTTKKVLLLAKRNVVVNPTQVLQTINSQTRLKSAITPGSPVTSITVYDAAGFQQGDWIESDNPNAPDTPMQINGTITGNSTSGYNVPVASYTATSTNLGQNMPVKIVTDPELTGLPYTAAIRLNQFTQAIQRRVQLNAGTTTLRLAFRHSGEYKKALEVEALKEAVTDPPTLPSLQSASFVNKLGPTPAVTTPPTSIDSVIQPKDKALTVNYTEDPPDTPATDTFPQTQPTSQTAASAITLAQLKDDMTTIAAARKAPNWYYQVTVDNSYDSGTAQPLYYFLAGVGNLFNNFYATVATPWASQQQDIFNKSVTIPMATSVWVTMNGQQVQLQDNQWNTLLKESDGTTDASPGFGIVNQFGFNPIFINSDGTNPLSPNAWQDYEDVLTSDQYFYQPNGTEAPASTDTYSNQTAYDNGSTQYTLDSRQLQGFTAVAGGNDIAIQLDNADVDDGTGKKVSDYLAAGQMPFYRLSNLKLQNEGFDGNTPPNLNQVSTGTTFDINAYVYAQEGGWYVISGPNFDQSTSSTDPIGVKNEQDLNRDGVISQAESAAAYRYHRYNYQIVFTGAIMENQTASPTNVSDWMDKWATVKLAAANFSGGSVVPNTSLTYDSANPATSNFADIVYYYDPTAAQGELSTDPGFHAPVAPGLIYQN